MMTITGSNVFAYSTLTKDNAYSSMAQLFVFLIIVCVFFNKRCAKCLMTSQSFNCDFEDFDTYEAGDHQVQLFEVFQKEFVRGRRMKKNFFVRERFMILTHLKRRKRRNVVLSSSLNHSMSQNFWIRL